MRLERFIKRPVYISLGFLFMAIGTLGVFLPVLPTTPFILLAAWCFAQSSERWHRWLLESRLFGGLLRDWEQNRCVSLRVKQSAVLLMALVGGWTLLIALDELWPRLITGILLAIGLIIVLRLKTCESET